MGRVITQTAFLCPVSRIPSAKLLKQPSWNWTHQWLQIRSLVKAQEWGARLRAVVPSWIQGHWSLITWFFPSEPQGSHSSVNIPPAISNGSFLHPRLILEAFVKFCVSFFPQPYRFLNPEVVKVAVRLKAHSHSVVFTTSIYDVLPTCLALC